MEVMKLNKLLDSFNLQADVVKNRLADLLVQDYAGVPV